MEEYRERFANWKRLDDYIKKVNAPGSGYTHKAAHNKFSDLHDHEFQKMMGLK
jgi:hypothetical protein